MNTRNATLRVYVDRDRDVVPPFLIGEVAADRDELRLFAETILEWLARTGQADSANVYRLSPGNGTTG